MNYTELDLIILKAIITNRQIALDFVSNHSTYMFENSLWNLTNLIVSYIKTYKDIPTLNILTDKLSKTTPALIEPLTVLWNKLDTVNFNEKEYRFYIEKMQHRFSANEILKLKEKLEHIDYDKIATHKLLDDLKKTIYSVNSISKNKTYDRKTLKESIGPFREEVSAKLANPDYERGISTFYSFLDSATGGIRPSQLLIIGGETNSGKSLLLMNIALQMWMQKNTIEMNDNFSKGYNVLYFSLEMPFKSCRNRIFSRLSGIPTKLIKQPVNDIGQSRLNKQEREKLKATFQFIEKYPYHFEIVDIPRGATPEHLEMLLEDTKTRFTPDIVVIDYLGLMDLERSNEDDWLKLGIIAGQVHEMCRVHNLIVLTAVQLNRTKSSSKDTEERVGTHRIGRSALILTHADIGIQIETRPNEKNYPDMITHLIKMRDGELGKGRLLKNLSCGTLLDTEIKEETIFTNIDDLSEKIDFFDI